MKDSTTVGPCTPRRPTSTSIKPVEPTSIMITRTKSIVQDPDRDRDPEPVTAKVNPFSPPRQRPVAESFASSLLSRPSEPKRVLPFPPLSTETSTNIIDDPSENPFLVTLTPSTSQPDSPFTKARKRLRGEDVEMEDIAFLSDKKRRLLSRTQSVSTSTIWSRGGSAANALRPDSSQRKDKVKDKDADMGDEEVLEPTPRKKDAFRPIFDDSPRKPTTSRTNSPHKATMSKTNSLPPGMQLFTKKKVDLSKLVEKMEGGQAQLPSLLSSSNARATPPPGKRKRSGSGTGLEFGDEDEDWFVPAAASATAYASAGPMGVLRLLPPSPPPANENEQRQTQQQQWKGKSKGKSTTGKGRKKAKIVSSEGTSGEEYNAVEELAWKPVGPLKRRAQVADIDGAEPDMELELEDAIIVAHSKAKLVVPVEEPEQEGNFEIDLPDQLKDILALAPSKRGREDEETIVRNLLAGKGEFLSKGEIWAAGEVPETHAHGDDDDDDWDGEPVGWWEAEL